MMQMSERNSQTNYKANNMYQDDNTIPSASRPENGSDPHIIDEVDWRASHAPHSNRDEDMLCSESEYEAEYEPDN